MHKHNLLLRSWLAAVVAMGAAGVLLAACDTAPGPVPLDQQPPEVANLLLGPDTIRVAELPDERLADGQAIVDIATAVTARDPDGSIDRVLLWIDPAYGTSSSGLAELVRSETDSSQFGGTVQYVVAADRADVLMIRAFAVDNDSLTSNQVAERIHILPDTSNEAN